MTGMGSRLSILLAVGLSLLAGCGRDHTQVVLVIQSDLNVPNDVDAIDVASAVGAFAPQVDPFFSGTGMSLAQFPLSVGFESGGTTTNFSVVVRLFTGSSTFVQPSLVMSRTVTDIRFVSDETMMLVLPMNRECACVGTSCPSLGNPRCENVTRPQLQEFDSAVAPPSSMSPVISGAGGAGVRPPTFDGSAR
jgi:hypothetical protein